MKGKTRVLSFKIKGNQKVEIAHFLSKFEDIVFNISDDTLKIKVLNSGSMGEIIYSIKSFLEELKESEVKEEKGMHSYTLDSISKIAGVTVPVKLLKVVLEDYGYSFEVNRENVVSTASVSIAAEYLSLIHISEPTRLLSISYAVFCLTKNILVPCVLAPPPSVTHLFSFL